MRPSGPKWVGDAMKAAQADEPPGTLSTLNRIIMDDPDRRLRRHRQAPAMAALFAYIRDLHTCKHGRLMR